MSRGNGKFRSYSRESFFFVAGSTEHLHINHTPLNVPAIINVCSFVLTDFECGKICKKCKWGFAESAGIGKASWNYGSDRKLRSCGMSLLTKVTHFCKFVWGKRIVGME